MGTSKKFSQEFKQAIVKKLLSRGKQTVEQFCEENGLALSTVTRWQSECANVSEMNHKKNKSKVSSENILKIISERISIIQFVSNFNKSWVESERVKKLGQKN